MNRIAFNLNRVKLEYYEEIKEKHINIEETSSDGAALLKVEFQSDTDKTFIRLLKEHSSWLNYAKNQRCADGIIIEINSKDYSSCNIYIFELKRKIDASKWTSDVKAQFRGATLRAFAFISSLGISQINSMEYFTCFVNSNMDTSVIAAKSKLKVHPSSPIRSKGFMGIKDEEILEWDENTINIFGNKYNHHKIQLTLNTDFVGVGSYQIQN